MNCIFCHQMPVIVYNGASNIYYKCVSCRTLYHTTHSYIEFISIDWHVDNTYYRANIYLIKPNRIDIFCGKHKTFTIPMEWMFAHTPPPIVQKLHNLQVFL